MSQVDALQDTLAAEHAALYLYGVLGARTSQSETPTLHASLSTGYSRHRSRRDALRLFVAELGAEPVAAAPAYDVPPGWVGPTRITRAALDLESASTEQLAALVAQTTEGNRQWAATELTWSAGQQLSLGATPVTWPGAPELE